jgi:hypothetical protein
VFRRKEFNGTMQYYMFYDMGATSTTATIVGMYHLIHVILILVEFYDMGATSTTATIVGMYHLIHVILILVEFYDMGATSTTKFGGYIGITLSVRPCTL